MLPFQVNFRCPSGFVGYDAKLLALEVVSLWRRNSIRLCFSGKISLSGPHRYMLYACSDLSTSTYTFVVQVTAPEQSHNKSSGEKNFRNYYSYEVAIRQMFCCPVHVLFGSYAYVRGLLKRSNQGCFVEFIVIHDCYYYSQQEVNSDFQRNCEQN